MVKCILYFKLDTCNHFLGLLMSNAERLSLHWDLRNANNHLNTEKEV